VDWLELWFTEHLSDHVRFSLRVTRHLYSAPSPYQQIDVFDSAEFGRVLVLDGYLMITERDEFIYHEMITHVPMAVHPNPRRVLVVGGGDGGTVRELCRYEHVEHIDLVEIDELVVQAAQDYFPTTSSGFTDPRVSIPIQ
jgi:spermidine synthase